MCFVTSYIEDGRLIVHCLAALLKAIEIGTFGAVRDVDIPETSFHREELQELKNMVAECIARRKDINPMIKKIKDYKHDLQRAISAMEMCR